MLEQLKWAVSQGLLRHVDYYFAQHLQELDGRGEQNLSLLAALASASVGEGNICVDLPSIAGTEIRVADNESVVLPIPSLDELLSALKGSSVVGAPGEQTPLILDDAERLYLGRYWWFELQVAEALLSRALPVDPDYVDMGLLKASLHRMFPSQGGGTDWQMVAAAMAVLRQFAVISGGPGTGKTHTVTTILALLIEQASDKHLNIAMAAPTGKAAARLTESIRLAKPAIACSEEVKAQIPEEASTIHRLIGVRPGKAEPRHHAGNPLHVDLLVVDEASMIDLPLMARLLQALPAHARLIMLGDKDQLASVEAGSVFADITGESAGAGYSKAFMEQMAACTGQQLDGEVTDAGFSDSVALLRKSYRFENDTGIGALARAINAGDGDKAMALLAGDIEGVVYQAPRQSEIHSSLAARVVDAYASCFASEAPREAIEQFNAFRIVCAVRGGPAGVEQVNQTVEGLLQSNGLIHVDGMHYKGRPIMVTRNDYSLGLFNGDVGILWPDQEANGALRAWFVMPDNTMKRVLPSRLPDHETAYAMTIHKSQGSEFNRVLVLLPYDYSEVLTRELLYTAITRAKHEVEVWGEADIVTQCIQAKVKRVTGLADKLYSI